MPSWLLILIIIAGVVVLGAILGAVIGKYLVKREKSPPERLLSNMERVIYTACVVVGAAVLLCGVFLRFPEKAANVPFDGINMADETIQDEGLGESGEYNESTVIGGADGIAVAETAEA